MGLWRLEDCLQHTRGIGELIIYILARFCAFWYLFFHCSHSVTFAGHHVNCTGSISAGHYVMCELKVMSGLTEAHIRPQFICISVVRNKRAQSLALSRRHHPRDPYWFYGRTRCPGKWQTRHKGWDGVEAPATFFWNRETQNTKIRAVWYRFVHNR